MKKYRLLALATYGIDKPRGGGQVVVSGMYKYLSDYFDVSVLSIVDHSQEMKTVTIKEGLQNILIPMSYEETKTMWDLERRYEIGLSDYVHINNISLSRRYMKQFKRLSDQADILIFEHPYLINVLNEKRKKTIYHAIDIEYLQKKGLYKDYPELLEVVRAAEGRACSHADAVFVTCEAEKTALEELYSEYVHEKDILIVPNCIDASSVPFVARSEHSEAKKEIEALHRKITCLFVGSWHPPNLEALEYIISELAPRNEEIQYLVIGSVKDYFFNRHGAEARVPDNVNLFGTLGEDEKWELYKLADFAINPMFSGAGMNVKMLEYMAAGLPIITTPFGARGVESGYFFYFESPEEFNAVMDTLMASSKLRDDMIGRNLHAVRTAYNFSVIARDVMGFIYKVILGDYNSYLIDSVSDELRSLGLCGHDLLVDTVAGELSRILKGP